MNSTSTRIFGLDILRALAILLVLLVHGIYFYTGSWDNFQIIKFIPDGVSIFFVLSGFLIGNILIKTFQKENIIINDLRNFWVRRWFRTLPAYYFVLLALISANYLIYSLIQPSLYYIKFFLFLQTINDGEYRLYNESWSLCVEEFFYVFIPALLYLLIRYTRFKPKAIFAFCITFVIVLGTAYTIYKIQAHRYVTNEDWDSHIRKSVLTRLNSIMYGVLGSYLLLYNHPIWKYKKMLLTLGLAIFAFLSIRPAFNIGPYYNYEQFSLESIATLFLLPYLTSINTCSGKIFKAVTFTSRISYSIYLINYTPLYHIFYNSGTHINSLSSKMGLLRICIFLTWSFGVGYLVNKFIETPMMKAREKFSSKEMGITESSSR